MTTTVVPTSAAELEELLGDDTKLKAVFAEGGLGELVTNYARATAEKDKAIGTQVTEQVQAYWAEFVKENGAELINAARPDLRPQTRAAHQANRHAPGAALDGQFESTGDLMQALFHERKGQRAAAERMDKIRNDFSSTVPADGGILVPEEFRAQLLQVALSSAVVRPRAQVIPMGTPRIKFPMIDSVSNASSVFGGIVGYWTEEAAQLVGSSARFGAVTLDAQKLTAYTEIPNELLNDSAISVAAFVDQTFPAALAWFEDQAFLRGSGVGEPLGVLTGANTATVTVAKESGQANGTILWPNIVKMYSRMLPQSLPSAVWLCNIDTFPALAQMSLTVGTGGSAVWLNNGVEGPPATILGRPVIFTEMAESLGTQGDISFVDMSYYLIGDRQQITSATSEHIRFNADTTAFRFIERVDGKPWLKTAITPNRGSNTLSPFVQLQAR